MYVVAIYSLKKDKETLSSALAAVLGVTIYEALARLRAPGNGPLIIAFFAEKERAVQLGERLQSEGFKTSLLTASELETEGRALIVKRFSLGEHELDITTDKGDSRRMPFKNIDLILRGTGIAHDVTTETVESRSVSPARAVLSGGMMITKTTKNVREVTTEERQAFVNIYARDGSPFVFRENTLIYDSLGPALQPARAANFIYLVAELRRHCPGALYDERLLSRAGQAALLGPSLDPEEHLIVATALLSKVLRDKI
ncbi:MAG TPA: hypothetical protein DCP92_17580 [Nitrospiraceae bacterium]|jgi:hypothetical protein|nr:hypothetical protein [Nitrospiraceae bacterium]